MKKHDSEQEYRLVGFDPETATRAKCPAEIEKGNRASARLIELLDSAKRIELTEVQCSCKPSARNCNFGRRCGVLTVDDRDVGAILIEANLAVPFICDATGCPRQKSWCK
jgi:endonuclease YncB( thermonuclease family)